MFLSSAMSLNDIAKAVEANQLELAVELISSEWNRLGAAPTIYGIIRSGSVPVLKLLRAQKFCSERDIMILCTNAFHELQIKQVCISYDMHLYLLRFFAAYGLHNFRGDLDVGQMKGGRSWMESIGSVVKWTVELRTRERWNSYLDFDNDVEFRLRMIHNELFFIKDRKELQDVPLKEVIFCVAVFVKGTNDCPGDFLYRTIINQRNLIQFLVAICDVMKKIRKKEKCFLRRHILKKMIKVYRKLKQIRSVMKLVQNVPAKLDEFSERDYDRAGAHMTIAAMKRFIQVFGEAIKNTPDSPNFPSKLNKMLPVLFHDSLWLNSKYRDLSSHGYPLSCLNMRESDQIFYYRHLKQYMMLIAISSLVFTVYIFVDCSQNLFGLMRRTTSIEDMQALVRYAGNNKLHANQNVLFRNIFRFLQYCIHQLDTGPEENNKNTEKTKDNYFRKQILVEDLNKVHREVEKHMTMVEIASFANCSIQSIHAMVDLKLQTFLSKYSFRKIIAEWQTGETMESDYYSRTAISMQSYIHRNIELDQTYLDEKKYQEETDKIFAHFTTEYNAFKDVSHKLKAELHESLIKGYYHNIFGLDHKAQAITKTLKSHYTGPKDSPGFKTRNREFKLILDLIRRNDEIQLQNEYRKIIQYMRQIFIENDCSTFEPFCMHFRKIPLKHRLALEYWQMQAMEILIKTKYFGDNFSTLKWSLPMIWGKSYRNYLAHDCLSYDLITVSSACRIFVNGFVLAFDSDELKIFSRTSNFHLQEFTSIEDKGFEWIKIQTNLLQAYRQGNLMGVNNLLQMNADTWGRFYCVPGKFLKHTLCSIAEVLAHDTPNMECINPAAVELSLKDPVYSRIIHRAEVNTNLLLNLELFDSIDIVEAIEQFKGLQPELVNPCIGAALIYLVVNGNLSSLQVLLKEYGDFSEKILNAIMTQNMNENVSMNETTRTQLDAVFQSQVCTDQNWQFLVRSNNLEALQVAFLQKRESLTESALDEIVKACCASGRLEMVKILLSHGVPVERIQSMIAINHRRWNIIKHLLNNGTDPWHDDGILMFASIIENNFKLLRHAIKNSFPTEFHHDILRCVAKRGSLSLTKVVINRVDDMWQCDDLIESALSNTDSQVVHFLLDRIFSSIETSAKSPELCEWMKTLNEIRILEYFKSESTIVLTAIQNNPAAAERIVKQILELTCINRSASFMTGVPSQEQSSKPSEIIELCSIMVDEILRLSNSSEMVMTSSEKTFFDEMNSFEGSVVFTIYSINPIADLGNNSKKIVVQDVSELMISLITFLRGLMDSNVDCFAIITGTLVVCNGTESQNHSQFILTRSAYCVIDVTKKSIVDLNGLLNTERFSVVHIIPPTASTIFLQNVLKLGADPFRMGSTKRTAFHVMLLKHCLLEHLKHLYQHCIETQRTHFPDGVHVFNFADIDGYTPLCYAVRVCNFPALDYMLQNGADPSVASGKGKAGILQDAILNRSEQIISRLLSHSPQLIHEPVNTEYNESALEKAVQINHCKLINFFLERGARLSHRNGQGMTAVGVAIQHRSLESLQVLLEFAKKVGESITDSVTGDGKSALSYAHDLGDLDTIKLLEVYIESDKR